MPSFELVVVEDGNEVLTMPVVVGRKDRRTPVLATQITGMVFNPTWTVPPTLLREDFLPKMQRNQGYATARGLKVRRPGPGCASRRGRAIRSGG